MTIDSKYRFTDTINKVNDLLEFYDLIGWNKYLHLSYEDLYSVIDNSWKSIYVYRNSKLIATGRIISDRKTNAYICGLGVLEEYRNEGIGREIMNKLIEMCNNENINIQLFCEEYLVGFYENLGFSKFATGMMIENRD